MKEPRIILERLIWLPAALGVFCTPVGVVYAQGASGAASPSVPAVGSPNTPRGEVASLAEEIGVLRAIQSLKATTDQLASLTTAVTQAQDRLQQQAQADSRALASLREPVVAARQRLIPVSVDLNDPQVATALMADQQVTNAQRASEQSQARLRDELATGLRQQLQTLLAPDQVASLVSQGRTMVEAERAQQEQQRVQQRQQWQQSMAARGALPGGLGPGNGPGPIGRGGPGGPGGRGGPGGPGLQRMLDRLRGMDSSQYQQMAPGFARRFGDEGTPAYQSALAMMDQIRSMPDDQFQQRRADLAQQLGTGMFTAQAGPGSAQNISGDHALDTWIQRYLLSPQAPAALKDLTSAASDTKGTP